MVTADYENSNDIKATRLVIVDHRGKEPTAGKIIEVWGDVRVVLQDDGRTVKVFLYDSENSDDA